MSMLVDLPTTPPALPAGWSLRNKNPREYVSPGGLRIRALKHAKRFAALAEKHGSENKAFQVMEAELRRVEGKRGRDLTYSVFAALPRSDKRARRKPPSSGTTKKSSSKKKRQERGGGLELMPSKAVGARAGPLTANGGKASTILFTDPGKVEGGSCFLDEFFLGRTIKCGYDVSCKARAGRFNPERNYKLDGGVYSPVSSRVMEEKRSGNTYGPKKRVAIISYVLTKGGGLPRDIDLQEELEKVADFQSLPPNKILARLELLTSPTPSKHPEYVRWTDKSYFTNIDESGNDGCGFAPPKFIEKLLGNTAEAERADAVQVRIFGPNVGILKGLLMKKLSATKIELPESMMKVPPSQCCNEDWVVVVVSDVFPSKKNNTIGSILDPKKKDPTPKTLLAVQNGAKFSEMYQRLFRGFGVPREVLKKYYSNVQKSAHAIKHTHLLGVADPTGQFPPGKIFIPGYVGSLSRQGTTLRKLFGQAYPKVFLSRSPALVPSDAKLVEVVNERPSSMTTENWNFLCSLRFGLVVFSAPLGEMTPLPFQVGEGDLDGDLYLCVFGKKILKSLDGSESPAKNELRVRLEPGPTSSGATENAEQASTEAPPTEPSSSSWLSVAQDTLLNLELAATSSALTGRLYGQCNKTIDKHGFAHRDAWLLSRAYKDSLDVKKHSLNIALPPDLRDKIPATLRGLIEINNSQSTTDNGDVLGATINDVDGGGEEAEDNESNCDAVAERDLLDDSGADGLASCCMDTDSEEYYF